MQLSKLYALFTDKKKAQCLNAHILKAYNATRKKEQHTYLCHAPFKAMLLSNNGRVLSCCFNRQAVLGQYPEQSLKEIWFGKEAQKLRQHLKKNDLSYGCFNCKNQWLNKEFETVKARMFDHLPSSAEGYPTMLEFDLDNTCNLECLMCNPDNSSAIRNKNTAFGTYVSPYNAKLCKELEEFIPHLHQVSFAGGEPFLIKLYYDIWEKIIAIKPSVRINITTNATILNQKIKDLLNKGVFEISVSLDSIDKNTYEAIRKNAHLETVMDNLNYFHNYCKGKNTFFGVWVCPLRSNRFQIPELLHYFNERGIEVYFHTVWIPPKVTLWNLSALHLSELHAFYAAQSLKTDTEVQKKNAARFKELMAQLKMWEAMSEIHSKTKEKNLSPSQLEYTFVKTFENILTHKCLNRKELNEKVHAYRNKLNYCKLTLPQETYNQALEALYTYPDEFIYQIFEAGSREMIADFFRYIL